MDIKDQPPKPSPGLTAKPFFELWKRPPGTRPRPPVYWE